MPALPVELRVTALGADDMPNVPGYDLVRVLGRGGMGVVFEAIELRFDRKVALKVHKDARIRGKHEELFREAFVAARIGDPGIVRVLDVGLTIDDRPFYAMELVQGTDLGALVADGPVEPRRAVAIALDIARAAGAAHEHGVIHRDLKPRNVVLDAAGRARVLDFGIAVDVAKRESRPDDYAGSPPYMAPEQWRGEELTPRTDVYAIGVILHEMLTGSRPFPGKTAEDLAAKILLEEAPSVASKNS